MIYGYIRVSTKEQKEDRQVMSLSVCGLKIDRIYTDKQSGKDFNRTGYINMMSRVRAGDMVVIKSIDRLGRNYREILEQWRSITNDKQADIMVLDMPILNTSKNKDLLGTLISDLVLQLLSYVAENERISIRQRQAEGIAAARARGVMFGRPKRYNASDFGEIFKMVRTGSMSRSEAIELIGCCENTYYKLRHELEEK